MATELEHKRHAQHNQAFLDVIDKNAFPDWAITVSFYKAVHLVEALFTNKQVRGGSHIRRNNTLKRTFPAIWRDYRPLYAFSRVARYWCIPVTPADLVYVSRRLARIERSIDKLP